MPELEKPGGLSYEFVLEEARTTGRRCETPSMKSPATPTPTAKDIERKLKVMRRGTWKFVFVTSFGLRINLAQSSPPDLFSAVG